MIESFHNVSNPSVSKRLHGERDTSKCLNPLSPLLTNIRSNREIQPSLSWQDCHIPEAVFPNKCLDRCCWESQRKRRDECCPVLNPTHSPNTLCICTVHCFPGPWATEVKALYRLDLTGTRDTDTGLYSDRMLYTYHLSTYLFLPPARDFFFLRTMCILIPPSAWLSSWRATKTFFSSPLKWIIMLLWTGKLLKIAVMPQPDWEDWALHEWTGTILKLSMHFRISENKLCSLINRWSCLIWSFTPSGTIVFQKANLIPA